MATAETSEKVQVIIPTILSLQVGEQIVQVGTGATEVVGDEKYPYTVVEILSTTKLTVQADNFKRVESDGQGYEYSHNPDGRAYTLTLYPDGSWKARGQGGGLFHVGERLAYRSEK